MPIKDTASQKALRLVKDDLARHPESRVADIYKLLYQSCMGPEHALSEPARALAWLEGEWARVPADDNVPLYEEITIAHPIYRINLAPAKAAGISPSAINAEFIALGMSFPKDIPLLKDVWGSMRGEIDAERISPVDSPFVREFDEMLSMNRWPAVHHSEDYRRAYRPAYRLVGKML